MDFDDSQEHVAFRALYRDFIAKNAPHELYDELSNATHGHLDLVATDGLTASRDWRKKRFENGWACVQWPEEYGGRNLGAAEALIMSQEDGPFSRLDTMFVIGTSICAPTIMAWGTDEQKDRLLKPIASGEEIWCQLFSEPAAGSDLAGIRTKAIQKGETWIVDGQKIWTSGGADSDWGMLLARTDSQVPKHHGLTMFYVDMRSPGISVKPIKQMNGQSHFNEVFLESVEIPYAQRIGEVGSGWAVALTLLTSERLGVGQHMATGFDDLLEYVKTSGPDGERLIDDPATSMQLAELAVRDRGIRYTQYRIMTAIARGEEPGPAVSTIKLATANTFQAVGTFGVELHGPAGENMGGENIGGEPGEGSGRFERALLRSPGARLEGGSDEILRNIIAERILNLPPEIRADKDKPFAENT